MSDKFKRYFWVTFIALVISWAIVMWITHGDLWVWLWYIWIPVLTMLIGISFELFAFLGWDFIDDQEAKISVGLGTVAALLVALAYKGIGLLLK